MKLVALTFLLTLVLAGSARADGISVTRQDDSTVNGCPTNCTLRQAIDSAGTGDTIELGAMTYSLTQGVPLTVDQDITIEGVSAQSTSIDDLGNVGASGQVRTMNITAGSPTIRKLRFVNGGDANDEGYVGCQSPCSTFNANGGGAIYSATSSPVTISEVDFSNNGAPLGGAISTRGPLTLSDANITGGGGYIGGGLFLRSNASIMNTTFSDITGGSEGVVYIAGGAATVMNATFSNNGWGSSVDGGGIVNHAGNLDLFNSTFSGNVRGSIETDSGASTTVRNTVIAQDNYGGDGNNGACVKAGQHYGDGRDTVAPVSQDNGSNLAYDATCGFTDSTSLNNEARLGLAPLNDNGGPVQTMALLSSSPALERGAGCADTDARGIVRPQGAKCDAGAFEARYLGGPTVTGASGDATDLTVAVLDSAFNLNGEPGKLHFAYGTDQGNLDQSSPGIGVYNTGEGTETLENLQPGTQYYFQAIVENASGIQASTVSNFTTPAGPPDATDLAATNVTDTTVDLAFTVQPNGADTTYTIRYTTGADVEETQPVTVTAAQGATPVTRTLTGLQPFSPYHVQVVLHNSEGDQTRSFDDFQTIKQLTGETGQQVQMQDTIVTSECSHYADIDWGDRTGGDNTTDVSCVDIGGDQYNLTIRASHVYRAPGHFNVDITTEENDRDRLYATITGDELPTVSDLSVDSSDDTSAAISFHLNAHAAPSTFSITYDDGSGPVTLPAENGGSSDGEIAYTRSLTGLKPNTHYTVDVIGTNAAGAAGSEDGPVDVYTSKQLTAVAGDTVTYSDSGELYECPNPTTIVWGDGATSSVDVTCTDGPTGGFAYTLSATHAYASSGRYHAEAQYSGNDISDGYAVISAVQAQPTPVPTASPAPTPTPTPTPTPVPGKTVIIAPAPGGTVLIKVKGTNKFVVLKAGQSVPLGSEIDTTHGKITLTSIPAAGKPAQSAVFYDGIFVVTQSGGITNLTLSGPLAACTTKGHAAAAAKKPKTRRLWGSGKGNFRTTGKYAAATIRGTTWLVQDSSCGGTLTQVKDGVVSVLDKVKHKTITVRAPHKYTAKPKKR